MSQACAGMSLRPALVSIMNTTSPRLISSRPISAMVAGVKALVMNSGPETSEAANALEIVPEAASSAAVALGRASVAPSFLLTKAATTASE